MFLFINFFREIDFTKKILLNTGGNADLDYLEEALKTTSTTRNNRISNSNFAAKKLNMGSTQDMQLLLAKKDARIRELEIENMELKSKLDKYQSIFPSSPPPASGTPGKKLID